MAIGLVGRKVGMTRIFTEDGTSIPVTVIEATPNRVTQLRTRKLTVIALFRLLLELRKLTASTKLKQVTLLKLVLKLDAL